MCRIPRVDPLFVFSNDMLERNTNFWFLAYPILYAGQKNSRELLIYRSGLIRGQCYAVYAGYTLFPLCLGLVAGILQCKLESAYYVNNEIL